MQQPDGSFKQLSEDQVKEFTGTKEEGKIIHEGQEVELKESGKAGARSTDKHYVIESIGERFVRVRSLPGARWKFHKGQEIHMEDCNFRIANKFGTILLLEGISK